MKGFSIVSRKCRATWAVILLSLFSLGSVGAHAEAPQDMIATVVAKVAPAVVRVVSVRPAAPSEADKPGAKVAADTSADQTGTAIGSGFIIDPAGYIATNKHVVDGAVSVFVVTADGVRHRAEVAGMTGKADMALLRIDAGQKLPFVRFGDSDKMLVGERVIAIGSPFGFDRSVTSGIISAVNRDIMESPFDDYLQTDAAINHGNSGGPLFNLSGEVIGMTSVIFSPDPGSSGVGFAIPSDELNFVFSRLIKNGKIGAGMLPIHTQPVTWMLQQALNAPDLQGALVTAVHDEGARMLQGKIKSGDVIRTYNGEAVLDPRDLARKAARAAPGSDAVLELWRGGAVNTVHVTIHEWPDAPKPDVVDEHKQKKLGLELASARGEDGSQIVTVTSVDPAGTAADSGIQKGDVIVQVQQTPISSADQALRIFWVRSSMKQHFAAVLVDHDKKLSWMSLAVPE